jgi:tripartite-type tricarboxylate transporter receptor subunit TctC
MKTRAFKLRIILAVIGALFLSPNLGVADFPDKPIQVLVGWPAGSQNDMTDRAITQVMQKILKQPLIIQNVPGGGGALVLGKIKAVKADGYTLFQTGTVQYSRTPHLQKVPYDSKDFAYLGQHAWFQYVLEVRADSPWKTYEELIDYVKKNPKKLRYTTSGVGTSQHVVMEYLAIRENLQWIHVPFTGGTECTAAILGGHVEVYSASLGAELEQIRAGRLRVLLSLSPNRVSLFPDVPSVLEKGYDFVIRSGGTWTVPAGTPKDIQRKLENALLQAVKDPTVIDVLNKWNWALGPLDSESLTKLVWEDYKINGELMKQLGLGIYKK